MNNNDFHWVEIRQTTMRIDSNLPSKDRLMQHLGPPTGRLHPIKSSSPYVDELTNGSLIKTHKNWLRKICSPAQFPPDYTPLRQNDIFHIKIIPFYNDEAITCKDSQSEFQYIWQLTNWLCETWHCAHKHTLFSLSVKSEYLDVNFLFNYF